MGAVQPGIYLEVKKGVIGTGVTAKNAEYRNFWMTLAEKDSGISVALLDQDFKLTGIRDEFDAADFQNGRLVYIPQGEKRYQSLLKTLSGKPARKPEATRSGPAADPEPAPAGSANWWESKPKDVRPGDIFKRAEETNEEKPSGKTGTGNWWEGGAKTTEVKDVFSRPTERAQEKKVSKPAGKSEVRLKKNWWET